jgi:phosphopantothenoylcysteine synthetase/decarboxylase
MHCIVTAGPTYEPLDAVRRLTNFSTGRLGSELAAFLSNRGHKVTLLIGQQATCSYELLSPPVQVFTTTADLGQRLRALAAQPAAAIFHAAAVSDFAFGKIWLRSAKGALEEIRSAKISTRQGVLLAELVPTPKLITELRGWFPAACIVGWKYEAEGDRAGAVQLGQKQLADCRTDACVVNGPAFGPGFGLVRGAQECLELPGRAELFEALEKLLH